MSDIERILLEEVSEPACQLEARSRLDKEGNAPLDTFLILAGVACSYKQRKNGRRQITALHIPGDIVAFDSSLQSRMDLSIETISACPVAWFMPETVDRLHQHPGLAHGLQMTASVDCRTMQAWLLNLGGRDALERLAHLLWDGPPLLRRRR